MAAAWSEDEIVYAVDAYLWMLEAQSSNRHYVKAQKRRELQQKLDNRSDAAIEFKFRNISAVLDNYSIEYLRGYLPAMHMQGALRLKVTQAIANRFRVQGVLKKPEGKQKPSTTTRQYIEYERDPFVREWVLQAAGGRCELCGKPAPFALSSGEPYLEVHHVILLADGGPDTPENTVALCPNCHRKVHYGADATKSRRQLYRKMKRLIGRAS